MDFLGHFREAQDVARDIKDWNSASFTWAKAYVACVFAAVAYEEFPQFELKKSKRAKIIPCDNYHAHLARFTGGQGRASIRDIETEIQITSYTWGRVLVTISKLPQVIFVALRGTTLSFDDFTADIDARKIKFRLHFGGFLKLHRGFHDAVADCFDEVVERVNTINENRVPVYLTGHSLGGAMAAIFHGRLDQYNLLPVWRYGGRISPAVSCYAFGMPRYCDAEARSIFPQPFHVFNEFDAIPTLPPTFIGFADSGNERCLNAIPDEVVIVRKGNCAIRGRKGLTTVLGISDHRMERYLDRVSAMHRRGVGLPPLP